MAHDGDGCPRKVEEYAEQAVDYVRRSLGMTLEFDSETLPVLDHYVRQVPQDQDATRTLVAATAGAYYGEVVRRRLGGRWETEGEPEAWRLVLPGGLSFAPAGFVAAAMIHDEVPDYDTTFQSPDMLRPILQDALDCMAPVSEAEYYSLCGRLDTLEHLQDYLHQYAAQKEAERREGSN